MRIFVGVLLLSLIFALGGCKGSFIDTITGATPQGEENGNTAVEDAK